MGPETGLETRLQQRSKVHLEDRAEDRYAYNRAQVKTEGPHHQECGWSSWITEKRVHGWRLQGRLHRVLQIVTSK